MDINRFETGISENNLKHWGEIEAVKEFIQNTVFAKTILKDDITLEYRDGKAIMSNKPHGFTKGKLLIGESDQAGVEGAPGQYGEGMKVAMAVACRLGLEVEVYTTGFSVKPALEPSSLDPSVRVLVFYIEDRLEDHEEGTTFIVQCTQDSFDKAKSYFAVLNGVDETSLKHNGILEGIDEGSIFVNGVKIAETSSLYSYNFTSSDLMNRDRTTVDMDRVKHEVRNTLAQVNNTEVATEIITGVIEEDDLLEAQAGINSFITTDSVWKKAIAKIFGDRVAIATGTESDTKARYHKFSLIPRIPNQWKFFFKENLEVYPTNELDEVAIAPTRVKVKPKGEESANLGWCKRLIKLYYADYGTVKIADKVVDEFKNECDGTYDHKTDTTWIARRVLANKEECFKTLLHETIHRVTGCTDNTPGFTQGWENACWGILQRGKK